MFGNEWLYGNDFDLSRPEEQIGVKGTNSGILNAGVGFVIIPKDLDVEDYIEDVMISGRISINAGIGYGDYHNIPVDREVLQRLRFPQKIGEHGSPVVWINIPKHNSPVVIACLKYDDDFHKLEENQKRTTRENSQGSMTDIDMNPNKNRMSFTLRGVGDLVPEMVFRVVGKDKEGRLILDIQGDFLVRTQNRIVLIADKKIEIAVSGADDKTKARIVMDSNIDSEDSPANRFLYEDDKGNKVRMNKDMIQLEAVGSSKIVFGEDDENLEPMVKGKTVVEKLEKIIDAINKITVNTAFGPSSVPTNTSEFIEIRKGLNEVLSELTNTQ